MPMPFPCNAVPLRLWNVSFPFDLHSVAMSDSHLPCCAHALLWPCGTIFALTAASIVYTHTRSYVAAAAAGWVGEGVGFYGYFISTELFANSIKYSQYGWLKRAGLAVTAASTNLLFEFAPAEVLDNFVIRPFLMFFVPQHIKPYALGFLAGKFSADLIFYALAAAGYESRKRWLGR